MRLGVDSPLEIYTTIFGWQLYNDIWIILTQTGLIFLPFLGLFIKVFTQYSQSQTGKDAPFSMLRRFELDFLVALVIILLAGMPLVSLQADHLTFTKLCDVSSGEFEKKEVTKKTDDSLYKNATIASIKEGTKIPAWWYAVLAFSSGLTHAAKQGIPCKDDIVSYSHFFKQTELNSPELVNELRNFIQTCYTPTRSFIHYHSKTTNNDIWQGNLYYQLLDLYGSAENNWFGSKIFRSMNNKYFYSGRFSKGAIHPFKKIVNCQVWLQGDGQTAGLIDRLWNFLKNKPTCNNLIGVYARDPAKFNEEKKRLKVFGYSTPTDVAKHYCLRQTVTNGSNQNLYRSLNHELTHEESSMWDEATAFFNKSMAHAGVLWNSLDAYPMSYSIQEAMPVAISVLTMSLLVMIPLGLVLSSYSIEFLITMSAVLFAMKFSSYLIYAIRWFNQNIMSIIELSYAEGTGGVLNYTVSVFHFVANGLYFVLPFLLVSVMAWSGIEIGQGITNAYDRLAGQQSGVAEASVAGSGFVKSSIRAVGPAALKDGGKKLWKVAKKGFGKLKGLFKKLLGG